MSAEKRIEREGTINKREDRHQNTQDGHPLGRPGTVLRNSLSKGPDEVKKEKAIETKKGGGEGKRALSFHTVLKSYAKAGDYNERTAAWFRGGISTREGVVGEDRKTGEGRERSGRRKGTKKAAHPCPNSDSENVPGNAVPSVKKPKGKSRWKWRGGA